MEKAAQDLKRRKLTHRCSSSGGRTTSSGSAATSAPPAPSSRVAFSSSAAGLARRRGIGLPFGHVFWPGTRCTSLEQACPVTDIWEDGMQLTLFSNLDTIPCLSCTFFGNRFVDLSRAVRKIIHLSLSYTCIYLDKCSHHETGFDLLGLIIRG